MKIITLMVLFLSLFSFSVKAETDVIARVYSLLNKDYINEMTNKQITLKGLQALTDTDSAIRISAGSNRLYFYYGSRMIKSFPLPEETGKMKDWSGLSKEIVAEAIKASSKVEVVDFEMPDRFALAVFKGLDGYSHYYGEYADSGNKVVRRNFATRNIDDILFIKILTFQKDVNRQVLKAVEDCPECRGVILDLRGNHGGILDEALKIADMFLDEGIITYTASNNNQTPHFYVAQADDVLHNKPLVILVDGFTASSAEVLSAALSEQNRAILIGTQTYGKGTIQDVVHMGGNRTMALTTAHFYTPSGRKIDKLGLMPAICSGGIKHLNELNDAECKRADRFNQEVDIEVAVKYIKNEL